MNLIIHVVIASIGGLSFQYCTLLFPSSTITVAILLISIHGDWWNKLLASLPFIQSNRRSGSTTC